jgi:glutathione peroxidase
LTEKNVDLSKYKGKTVLIVNTASKCGYTKQYAGLQQLHEKYGKKGLAILGFPANNFGAQEPGSDSEIGEFCRKNYGVSFDMFSKLSVKGTDKAPFFRFLTEEANPTLKGEIDWNFEKFLISRDGQLVSRFKSGVAPDAAEFVGAIESEINRK